MKYLLMLLFLTTLAAATEGEAVSSTPTFNTVSKLHPKASRSSDDITLGQEADLPMLNNHVGFYYGSTGIYHTSLGALLETTAVKCYAADHLKITKEETKTITKYEALEFFFNKSNELYNARYDELKKSKATEDEFYAFFSPHSLLMREITNYLIYNESRLRSENIYEAMRPYIYSLRLIAISEQRESR